MTKHKDNPNVIAPPPLIFFSGLLLGGLIEWNKPFPVFSKTVSLFAGIILIFVGLLIILAAWLQMRKAKTNIEPWKPTTVVLDTGLYAFSRNPIYAAMVMIYVGVSFLINSFWILMFLPFVILIIHFGVILREEKYLENKFGDSFRDYKSKVRRWV